MVKSKVIYTRYSNCITVNINGQIVNLYSNNPMTLRIIYK